MIAYAGQPDFQQQQMILNKAYESAPVQEVHVESVQVREPDIFDQSYVFLRTFVPGWMMGLFLVVGMVTMAVVTFKRQLKALIIMWGNSLGGK